MPSPILATKLYIPPQAKVVCRPRLLGRLDEALGRKLTLVSAPAGFGKTTLVSDWAAGCERPVAWLSLDEGDGDLTRFLTHLVAALRTVAPTVGQGVLGALSSPRPAPTEGLLTALLNDINTLPDALVLVLDDLHLVDSRAADYALAFLLEHLPPPLHLIIATREDPALPLARLRARGQLVELRAAELRFSPAEAAEFLGEVMGLGLSADEVARLEARTEGWIAGLQLAALSLQGRPDSSAFVRAFTGGHRFVLDYLVEEVLGRQPERVRRFLLHTSVLGRLSGPLCDAVTGGGDAQGMLEDLERHNLFVVPLDDRRHWYRYHHLFAEVLRARLLAEQPGRVAELHRRASSWFERHGLPDEAIGHALAAGDFERAAGLIELTARAMLMSRREETFLGWLKVLPDALIQTRPVLGVYCALALVPRDLEAAEIRLQDAERALGGAALHDRETPTVEPVVVAQGELRALPGIAAITRAYLAGARGDTPGSVSYASRALDRLPEDEPLWRGAAAVLLGLAQWTSGDLAGAYRSFSGGMASLKRAGDVTQDISGAFIMASIRAAQGRLLEAANIYERALALTGESTLPGTADLHVGLSELRYEQNNLGAAAAHLLRSEELGERGTVAENRHRWHVAMARVKAAQGDMDSAEEQLGEAQRRYLPSPEPNLRPIAALRARLWLRQGRVSEALAWARERGLSPDDDLSYLLEFEYITLARVLIARYQRDRIDGSIQEAMRLLERLLKAAEEGERTGSVVEILVLQALAQGAQGDATLALAPLVRALTLAEPEGYARIFLDEGEPLAALLQRVARNDNARHVQASARKLLAAFGAEGAARAAPSRQPAEVAGLEPLSPRELEVLRLVAQGLSNEEIGRRLFRALSTVKGHNRLIFDKLGVKNRTEAVARARELGLL